MLRLPARESCCRILLVCIPIVAGTLLVLSASLKIIPLIAGSAGESEAPVWVVNLELLIGLGLILRVEPVVFRWSALLLFSLFVGVSVERVVAGVKSCGCFGATEISPLAMAVIDSLVVIGLYLCPPPPL